MRNLTISSVLTWVLPDSGSINPPHYRAALVAFDLDEKCVYTSIESITPGLSAGSTRTPPKVTFVKSQPAGSISVRSLLQPVIGSNLAGEPLQNDPSAYTSTEPIPDTYPKEAPFILSFHLLPESRNLVLILANGEIVLHPTEAAESVWDVVGTFEGGLEAASWSPDDSLLVLATSESFHFGVIITDVGTNVADGKLVQMTTDFEALREKALRTAEFGEGISSVDAC